MEANARLLCRGAPPRPYKVVRIVTRLIIGGPSIHVMLLTRGMASLGYQTTLVSGTCESGAGDMDYSLDPGDSVHWVPEMSRSVRPWKNLLALARLWRLMRQERPVIVHTHTAMAGCLGRAAALLAGVPIIVHTFHGNSLRHYFSPLASSVLLRIERLLARVSDAICVVSPQQMEELSTTFRVAPPSKFRVVPLGLDLSAYLALAPPSADGGVLRVGWFGRLVPVKNIPLLLRVAEAVLARSDRIEFHVAGDGPEREVIQEGVRRWGPRFVWYGWQRHIIPVLAKCDVLIQTSLNEGTPVALIQGMAAARPFVSTAVGGVVNMVSGGVLRNGNGARWFANAVLVDDDPSAFAHALCELAQDFPALEQMGRQARLLASTQYRKEALLANLDALYRELIERKLPGA